MKTGYYWLRRVGLPDIIVYLDTEQQKVRWAGPSDTRPVDLTTPHELEPV